MFRTRRGEAIARSIAWLWGLGIILFLLPGCVPTIPTDIEQPPPRRDVALKDIPSYSQDIQPVFNDYCVKCHNPQDAHMGLRLDTYGALMKGSKNGPVIIAGNPQESILLNNIKRSNAPPSSWMPFHQDPLTPNRTKDIENWVTQGAPNN